MTDDSANLMTSVTINILTKFAMTITALKISVTKGILILANLVEDVVIIRKMCAYILMLPLPLMIINVTKK